MKSFSIQTVFVRLLPAAGLLLFVVMLSSCDRSRNDKGYEYFPDMAHSLAYETYAPNPVFGNGTTQQAPVPGTVSREVIPYPYANTPDGRLKAGQELSNTLESSPANLERGKQLYGIFCSSCHGEKGLGDGHLYTSKRYPVPPASFQSPRVMGLPAGELYHVITSGYNVMGPHGSQIKPDDRWRIIMYLQQELQNKK